MVLVLFALVLMFIDRRGLEYNGVNGQERMLDAARTLAGGGINMVQGRP